MNQYKWQELKCFRNVHNCAKWMCYMCVWVMKNVFTLKPVHWSEQKIFLCSSYDWNYVVNKWLPLFWFVQIKYQNQQFSIAAFCMLNRTISVVLKPSHTRNRKQPGRTGLEKWMSWYKFKFIVIVRTLTDVQYLTEYTNILVDCCCSTVVYCNFCCCSCSSCRGYQQQMGMKA